jgi:hypothetical protein
VTLTFSSFNTQGGADVVEIRDEAGTLLSRTSGTTLPPPATATRLLVTFATNASFALSGWSASWTSAEIAAGDYDVDGDVDDADYDFWKANFGATAGAGLAADGNGNGVVDAADFTVWRDNLGVGTGSGAGGGTEFVEQTNPPADPPSRVPAGAGAIAAVPTSIGDLAIHPPALPGDSAATTLATSRLLRDQSPFPNHTGPVRAALRMQLANVARRDDGLLAWIASRRSDERRDDRAAIAGPNNDHPDNVTADHTGPLDEAFALLTSA